MGEIHNIRRTVVLCSLPASPQFPSPCPPTNKLERKCGKMSSKGDETRDRILAKALQVASVHGLSGLTIGELAQALQLSKSGLFAHFQSKERLQAAVLDAAADAFAA